MIKNHSKVPVLEMHGITKHFPGVLANDHVDLELYSGEVLALLGENGAGKSTLMNILVGLYRQDDGEIYVRHRGVSGQSHQVASKRVEIHSPRDASALGIGMVHQNFMLVETMTVAENIILGMDSLSLLPKMEKVVQRIRTLSKQYNLQVDPRAYIWQLSVGEQQRVEILKLIYRGAEILILDEPTAVLTPQEAEELNGVIKQMTEEGKSAIFITHKLDEVMAFSDRVCVLKQGRVVATKRTSETNPSELARLMVGREVLFRVDRSPEDVKAAEDALTTASRDTVLELRNVHALDEKGLPALRGISLSIKRGQILGIAGVAGNGQRELAEVVTGLRKVTRGHLLINGVDKTNQPPLNLIKAGVSHIPADRIGMGVVGDMSVASNLAMKGYRTAPLTERGVLHPRRILDFATQMIEVFRIATPTPETRVKFLSGGNIQKTILAREIDACSGLLVAVYPSRGLDVGATESVRKMLLQQRDRGTAILFVSEDLDELLAIADRIAVLFEGRIMESMPSREAGIETLGLLMAGVEMDMYHPADVNHPEGRL
jgi:simple sugar transport system ATP-binding protein